ncbi:hypothetical protein [Flavobacterium sedimenticola]|uniref:Uncharacterized protein n=1 Tax=Flavobacterium sedimenticola TaxID=3043286 RepID=A0ABT6XR19_9FLAO|nr:hypothetical protein [Flavobacterium sedimenticola]MDI9257297.1 hypothetical protein [Flavobacterium sedimenticola]
MKKQPKKQKEFTRFIPSLVKEQLDKLEYKRKDDLYCIIDLIYRKQVNYKTELQKIYGYVELPNSVIKKLVADSNSITAGLNFLVENKIIDVNPHYYVGVFSKSYKINPELLSKKVVVTITDKNINKRIELLEKENRKFFEKRLEFSKTNYFNTFKIDYKAAYEYIYNEAVTSIKLLVINNKIGLNESEIKDIIDCKGRWKSNRGRLLMFGKELHNILHRFTTQHFKILCINNGYLYFKRNDTNGRLDTNLTNLPTGLRQFLISDEKLFNIDIKNSQPYFLYCLLKVENAIPADELEKYGKLVVDGVFYEYLADQYKEFSGKFKTRKDMKGFLFKIFFSKTGSFPKIKEFFGHLFPNIMNYINENNAENNAVIANKLSTIESTTIISVILPALGELGVKPFTIHDSFVCKESEIQTIIDVFQQKTQSMFGITPSLHVKTLVEDSNDSTEIEDDVIAIWDDEFLAELNGVA